MKTVIIEPGSIVMWRDYNVFKSLWYKLRRKKLPYNRFTIFTDSPEFYALWSVKSIDLRVPVRKYNKQEMAKLTTLIDGIGTYKNWNELATIINLVRPRTFNEDVALVDSKYYKSMTMG